MKYFVITLITAVAYGSLLAIPTTINGIFQASQRGQALTMEEWFRNPKKWEPGAELPGPWKSTSSDSSHLSLDNPGAVFGIESNLATVMKNAAGGITELQVVFTPDKAGTSKSGLLARLKTNVGVFQGSTKWQQAGALLTNVGKELTIALHQDAASGRVTARITHTI